MSLLQQLRRLLPSSSSTPETDPSRRRFMRGFGGAAAGAGLLLPGLAWDDVEARARAFGIEPGTLVDAQGRPMSAVGPTDYVYLGEIMIVGFNFPPRGWAQCDGQLLPISQYSALFSLLGTMYGGDGRTTFGLPELRGRFPMHEGNGPGLPSYTQGAKGGEVNTTLSINNMPSHTHTVSGAGRATSANGTSSDPAGNIPARPASGIPQYADPDAADATFGNNPALANTGGGQSFSNMPPYLVLNFCIALEGIYPSRS